MTPAKVQGLTRASGYDGFFKIGLYRFRHELFEGGESPEILREVFERGSAAAVLPFDPSLDRILMIRQFLIGAHLAGVHNRPLQVVAGMIEEGEEGSDVDRREAIEEADCPIGDIVPGPAFLSSPGGSSERTLTYVARADLSKAGGIHGLAKEDENILTVLLSPEEAFARLDAGEIEAAHSVILLQWLRLNIDRLRAQWI